ncbi:hypothetical protein [Xanthocytophaga flava]|uniref:hypothetical protein n=1 Tax=Xanthocytophaga flava TaxID=3048013 RepID=UPI0028D3E790|nr:hypothetical protein [Xanthocytophaga flavus]MDJ1470346.1 hypothetical protein [Xanthocytophaga flavus]
MKIKHVLFPLLVTFCLLIMGCPGPKKDDLNFKEVTLAEIDTTEVTDTSLLAAKNVSGYAAKYWGRVMKHCMQSLLLKKKDADYLGPSNTLGLGTITDENLDITYRLVDGNTFSDAELNKIIKLGASTLCQFEISSDIDIEAIMNTKLSIKSDDDLSLGLGTAIKNRRKVNFNVESWQKDELIAGELRDALADESNPKKKAFKEDLLKEGRIIMTRLIRVKGFSADIELKNDIPAELKAKLSSEVIANLGNADATVKVSVVNNKTIRLKSTDDFFIYGKFVKAEKL